MVLHKYDKANNKFSVYLLQFKEVTGDRLKYFYRMSKFKMNPSQFSLITHLSKSPKTYPFLNVLSHCCPVVGCLYFVHCPAPPWMTSSAQVVMALPEDITSPLISAHHQSYIVFGPIIQLLI